MSDTVENQNKCIKQFLLEFATFLTGKNTSYDGSVFKGLTYAGRTISALDTIDVRISDKIRRLASTDPNFDGEDAELDLLGYLVLKKVVQKMAAEGA